jgi:hypothetical protein
MATQKLFDIKVLERQKDGGRIIISTGAVDRDKDRVFPQGGKIEDYMRNPVVQFAHNYYEPWATVGRTRTLEITETGIIADFELRPAANDVDPQNIVLLLWEQEYIRAASIGFIPDAMVPNDLGGMDFVSWQLLEWSICAVPANQDALRLAAEAYPKAFEAFQKRGRVLSAANEKKLKQARDQLDEVLAQLDAADDDKSTAAVALRQVAVALGTEIAALGAKLDQLLAQRPTLPAPVPDPVPTPDDDPDAAAVLARLDSIKNALSA